MWKSSKCCICSTESFLMYGIQARDNLPGMQSVTSSPLAWLISTFLHDVFRLIRKLLQGSFQEQRVERNTFEAIESMPLKNVPIAALLYKEGLAGINHRGIFRKRHQEIQPQLVKCLAAMLEKV